MNPSLQTPEIKKFNESHSMGSEIQIKHADGSVTSETLRWHEAEEYATGMFGVWLKGVIDIVDFERVVV